MKALLVCLVVLAGIAGAAALSAGYSPFASPEAKSCARLEKLCDGKGQMDAKECEQAFTELRKMGGDASVEKTASCLGEAQTCAAAAGCVVGGIGGGMVGEFMKGLGKSLETK